MSHQTHGNQECQSTEGRSTNCIDVSMESKKNELSVVEFDNGNVEHM